MFLLRVVKMVIRIIRNNLMFLGQCQDMQLSSTSSSLMSLLIKLVSTRSADQQLLSGDRDANQKKLRVWRFNISTSNWTLRKPCFASYYFLTASGSLKLLEIF